MVTLDAVAKLALALPEVTEGERHGNRSWSVGGKVFAWERPLTRADVRRFGAEPVPEGPIVAIRTEDLGEKEAILAAEPAGFFDMQHFHGYPAVLVQLPHVARPRLREALLDGWLACAPAALVEEHLAERRRRRT